MGKYEHKNVGNVLAEVNSKICEGRKYMIRDVCTELSIFDWWNDTLSQTQLKAMRTFLREAKELGFDGYCCFKVGASGCASGMWAYKTESEDGYSPRGDYLYRSFQSRDNYWTIRIGDTDLATVFGGDYDCLGTARALRSQLRAYKMLEVVYGRER